MTIRLQRLSADAFDHLEQDWNALLSRSQADNIFLRWEWIHTWWNILKKRGPLLLVAAFQDDRLIGIAPFYIQKNGLLRTRTLRFCSDELAPDYLDLIVEKGREIPVLEAYVNYLKSPSPLWDVLALDHVLPGSILLTDQFLLKECQATATPFHECPYIRLEGTFDEYYSRVTGRQELSRKQRVLFEKRGVQHHVIKAEDELKETMGALFKLHELRKHDQGLITSFVLPDVQRFHEEVSNLFLKKNLLSLHMLSHEGTPIGVKYGFNYKNKMYMFNSGFDPAWGRSSVGAILIKKTIEQAFQAGYEEYDFLKGNEGYKSLWANAMRREVSLKAYNQTLRGSLWKTLDRGRSTLKGLRYAFRSLSPSLSK